VDGLRASNLYSQTRNLQHTFTMALAAYNLETIRVSTQEERATWIQTLRGWWQNAERVRNVMELEGCLKQPEHQRFCTLGSITPEEYERFSKLSLALVRIRDEIKGDLDEMVNYSNKPNFSTIGDVYTNFHARYHNVYWLLGWHKHIDETAEVAWKTVKADPNASEPPKALEELMTHWSEESQTDQLKRFYDWAVGPASHFLAPPQS